MLSTDKSRSWCCSSFKLLLVRERGEVRECTSSGSTQLNSSPAAEKNTFPPTAPNSSRSGGLEGCSGRGAATASCSLNQEPPPACLLQPPCLSCTFYSAVEQNTTTCSANLIILQKEAKVSLNQYYSPSAGQQPLSCKCNLSSLLLLLNSYKLIRGQC